MAARIGPEGAETSGCIIVPIIAGERTGAAGRVLITAAVIECSKTRRRVGVATGVAKQRLRTGSRITASIVVLERLKTCGRIVAAICVKKERIEARGCVIDARCVAQ